MDSKNLSRRGFLKQTAALSASIALSSGVWNQVKGAEPSVKGKFSTGEKVNMAFIGLGAQGGNIARALFNTGMVNVVALCDTDLGSQATAKTESMFPNAKKFQDFREMFAKIGGEIEAISVGVPDHSHFPICMEAMMNGKHVYVEKPLARTFQECELLMAAEKKFGVVTQMGNQGHSGDNYYQFRALEKAGIIKDITKMTVHMNSKRRWHGWNPKMNAFPAAESIPSTLDWDTWLSGVHHHDYQKDFVVGQWRCWYDFGMGALGDWGAHLMDTTHEFLELGLPYEINPLYLKDHNPFFFPMSTTLEFKFPKRNGRPPLTLTWYDGLDNIPELPAEYSLTPVEIDSDIPPVAGEAYKPEKLGAGKELYSENGLIFKGGSHAAKLSLIQNKAGRDFGTLPEDWEHNMPSHHKNFLLAVQGKCKPNSPFSVTGPLSQVFCLGVLAQRLGTKLEFDREKKIITNNPLANIMLRGDAPRPGWEKYYYI
ncbi:MAG: Gfo/Idh/MocA family oxidoreductase [Rikenellaceae bacterium]